MNEEYYEQIIKVMVALYKRIDTLERQLEGKPPRMFVTDEFYLYEMREAAGLND
jgi:hypothetical protein